MSTQTETLTVTISKVETVEHFSTVEPGGEITITALLDAPLVYAASKYREGFEVVEVTMAAYSDREFAYVPFVEQAPFLRLRGYVHTKSGARNKAKGYHALYRAVLTTEDRERLTQAVAAAENLPQVLR